MIEKYTVKGKTKYRFQIRYKNKATRRSGFNTKTEAIQAYNQLYERFKAISENRKTYYEAYTEWIEIYKTKVKDSTINKTMKLFENHIFPYFKEQYVDEIQVHEAQQFIMYCSQFVRGQEYFNQAKRIITYSKKMGYTKENPFENVIEPNFKKSKTMINFLTPEEIQKLLDYFKDDLYWHTLFRLMIYTGIRRGEALALTWDDINFKKKTLSINKTLALGIDNQPYISTTKTESSNRILLIDDSTIFLLKKLKFQSNNNIIFPSRKGKYNRLANISDKLNKAIKETGIKKIRVHDLRHTHASLLFASGANAKEVQDRLGHADIYTTMNIYTHVTKDNSENTLNRFVDYLEVKKS